MQNLLSTLKNKITIFERLEEVLNDGTINLQWKPKTSLWCKIEVLQNTQWFDFKASDDSTYYQVTIRFNEKIKISDKIEFFIKSIKQTATVISVKNDLQTKLITTLIAEQKNNQ